MAIRTVPFGAFGGFAAVDKQGVTCYYAQGFTASLLGMATQYNIQNKIDSTTVSGMGIPKYFAKAIGKIYAQDDSGQILQEGTPGAYNFSIVHSPGGNGAGILGDQYNRLLYASNNNLGMYDGTTWTDLWQGLNAGQHPMDTYEDLVVIANGNGVAVLFSDNSFNGAALSLPSGMAVTCIRSGPTGILLGANFGYQGAVILWDGNATRSKTPWKWFNGQILSIDVDGANWIVKTTRGVYLTNGYTVKELFGVLDDPLAFNGYSSATDLPQQILVVGDVLIFLNPTSVNGPASYEFGRLKPGLYVYHISTGMFDYVSVPTGNSIKLSMYAAFADVSFQNRILIGYRDQTLGVNYIAQLSTGAPSMATFISETIGVGRVHYQRLFFGPTDKIAEAVVLNLGILSSVTMPATVSFQCALKIYDFKRQLWGAQLTSATTAGNAIRVDGTNTGFSVAQVGDEVTMLEGANAGMIAHITSISNQGTTSEVWTLDTTFPNNNASNCHLNVQPWKFVEKKTFTSLSQLKTIYYDIKDSNKAKQFLVKLVFSNIGANLQLEMQTSYFVFDDIGYDQP